MAGCTEPSEDEKRGRQIVGTVFVGVLYGVAMSQMLATLREAFPTLSPTVYDLMLPIVFVVTSSRFAFGHAFHFVIDKSLRWSWSLDAGFVFVMSFIMILLGLTASIEASRTASVGFVTLLISLYIVVVVFLAVVLAQKKKRKDIHKCWVLINAGATVLMLLVWARSIDFYSPLGLSLVLLINLGAFGLDATCSLALQDKS